VKKGKPKGLKTMNRGKNFGKNKFRNIGFDIP
jgi:hypothetical protein